MGLTAQGYTRRTYEDILNAKIQRAKELFGEDMDTGDQTALGKFIRINAYDQALAEEEAEAIYYARFPNTASGQSLDRLLVFGGLSRNPAEAAKYSVKFKGSAGYEIPVGFLVGTDTEINYYTVQAATIGEDGECSVDVCCTESGSDGNVSAAAINVIVNPDANVESVSGQSLVSAGRDEESDADLRARLKASITGAGSSNENAIRAALLRVPTVRFADVIVNDGDTADSEGRPAHSFECYVLGGNDYEQEIAEAIFSKRPIGIQTVGSVSKTVIDTSGNSREIKFSYAPNVSIHVQIKLKTSTLYPDDGDSQIMANVSNYINGLGIGTSLVLTSLYSYIYSVAGVTAVTSLKLSTDGGSTYTSDDVIVPAYSVAVCAGVSVEVGA